MEMDPIVVVGTFLLGIFVTCIYFQGWDKIKEIFSKLGESARQTGFESRSRSTLSGHELFSHNGKANALTGSTSDSFFSIVEDYGFEAGTSGGAALLSTQSYEHDDKNGWGLLVLDFESRDPQFFLHWDKYGKCMLNLMQEELRAFVKWNLTGGKSFANVGGVKISWQKLAKVVKEVLPKTPEEKNAVSVAGFPRTLMDVLQEQGEATNPTPVVAMTEETGDTLEDSGIYAPLPLRREDSQI